MDDQPDVVVDELEPISGSRPTTSKSLDGNTNSRPGTGLTQRTPANSRPTTGLTQRVSSASRPSTGANTRLSSGSSSRAWDDGASVKSAAIDETEDDKANLIQLIEPEKGCWHTFSTCVGGMWASKEMKLSTDKEIVVRTTIRELIVYMLFLLNLCILTFGMTSSVSFYYTQAMQNLFFTQDYFRIYQIKDFWRYMEGDMLNALYWEYAFQPGDQHNYICPGGEDRIGPCPLDPSDRNILYENRLLGLPRIRMIRVRNDSCVIHPDFQNAISGCYGTYTKDVEDTSYFGSGFNVYTSEEAWSYQSQTQLGGAKYVGYVASYTGGGAVQELHSLKNESYAILHELKELLWIDSATRFISLDFTLYNANLNLFCIAKFAFELPATGGIKIDTRFRTVKLIQYVNSWDFFILGCGIIHVAFIVYYSIEEFLEILKTGIPYFFAIWNVMDLVVLVISTVAVIISLNSLMTIEQQLTPLLETPDTFSDFSALGASAIANKNVIAILVFFAAIKLFKYIAFNKTMTQLSSTLSTCAKDVAGFGVMFFIVFFAFAQLGYVLFGAQIPDYSNFSNAIFALLRVILGDFDFDALMSANRTLGPGFFLAYVLFVFFILLNMFLAIINDTYTEVKEDIQFQKNDFEIGDYVMRGVNNAVGKMGNRDRAIDIENAIKFASDDGIVTFDEVRQNLKKCNFSDMEIEMFFCRYDVDGNFQFDSSERAKILNDLDHGRLDDTRHNKMDLNDSVGGISLEEFNMLDRRVDRMEQSMSSIISKIDLVLVKLDHLERAKSKRKDAMDKILGTMSEDDGMDDEAKRKKIEAMVRGELESWDKSRPGSTLSIKK